MDNETMQVEYEKTINRMQLELEEERARSYRWIHRLAGAIAKRNDFEAALVRVRFVLQASECDQSRTIIRIIDGVSLEKRERDYVALIDGAVKAMLEKLRMRENHGDWREIPIDQLFVLVLGEIRELYQEINPVHGKDNNLKAIRFEAADCINYLAMIIQKCDQAIKGEDEKQLMKD